MQSTCSFLCFKHIRLLTINILLIRMDMNGEIVLFRQCLHHLLVTQAPDHNVDRTSVTCRTNH